MVGHVLGRLESMRTCPRCTGYPLGMRLAWQAVRYSVPAG
jgi:hypothetical protein